MPFAPVHLLFINLLTDSLPAIALGLEPDRSEVMSEKPRLADESILTKDFLSKIGLEGLVIGAMTMISFLTGYNQNGTLLGSTYAFGTLCLARLFHGYNCKSDHPVIFTKGLFHNKWLQGAFVLGAVLITTVLTVPGFHNLFKVETLNLMQLGCVYLYCICQSSDYSIAEMDSYEVQTAVKFCNSVMAFFACMSRDFGIFMPKHLAG